MHVAGRRGCYPNPMERMTLRLAHRLREGGKTVAYPLSARAVGKQMKAAAKEGARTVVILGPDELARDCVLVRDMASGEQRETPLDELG